VSEARALKGQVERISTSSSAAVRITGQLKQEVMIAKAVSDIR